MSPTLQGKAPDASPEVRFPGSPGTPPNTAPQIESFLPLPNRYLKGKKKLLKGEKSLFSIRDSALRTLLALAWLDFGFEGGENPTPCLEGHFYGRKEIEEAAGLPTSTARSALDVLVEEGLVEQRDRGGRGMAYRLCLTITTKEKFTKVPTSLLRALPALQRSETKILLGICRKTLGYHKRQCVLAERCIRNLTGLSRKTIRRRLKALIDRGLIFRTAANSENGRYAYGLNLEALRTAAAACGKNSPGKAGRTETPPPDRARTAPAPRQKHSGSAPIKDLCKDPSLKKRKGKEENGRSATTKGCNKSYSDKPICVERSIATEIYPGRTSGTVLISTDPSQASFFDEQYRSKVTGVIWFVIYPDNPRWQYASDWLDNHRRDRSKVYFGSPEHCPADLKKFDPTPRAELKAREALPGVH